MEINEIIKQSINLLLKEKSVNVIKSKQFLNDVYTLDNVTNKSIFNVKLC
jgi:hypothetical protein